MSNLMQPKGAVAKDVNCQSIARALGIKFTDVGYIEINQPIDSYIVLYDPVSEQYFFRGTATGNVNTWSVANDQLTLATTVNNYTLGMASILKSLNSPSGASQIGGLGFYNPQMYGAVGDGVTDDTTAITNMFNDAITNDMKVVFPAGTYNCSSTVTLTSPVDIELSGGAFLNFTIIFRGELFAIKNKVQITATWATFPAGTNSVAGNFSAFNPSSIVAIKLNDTNGGSAGQGNEAGIDFSAITTASATSLILTTPTRLAYNLPEVLELEAAVQYSGTIDRNAYTISGNYTSYFKAGDIVRFENIAGADGVEASKFYFEFNKVKSVTSTAIVFYSRLNYSYTNPWLSKTSFISGINISGDGRIKRLEVRQFDNVHISGVQIDRRIIGYGYDLRMVDCDSIGVSEPSTSNLTYVFGNSYVSNIKTGGSASSTDNAAFKVMSCPRMIISNITSRDMSTTSGSQGNYGFYIDAYYTPYYCANSEMTVSNIYAEIPRSTVTRSIWFFGLRNCQVSGITGSQLFLQGCVDTSFDGINIPNATLEIRDLVRCTVSAISSSAVVLGCNYSTFDLMTKGIGTGSSANIACRIGAGVTNPETGAAYTAGSYNRFDVISNSTSASAISLQCSNQQFPLFGNKCRDLPTVAASIAAFGSNVTSPRMEGNFLQGSIPASSGWQGSRMKGGFTLDGNYVDANIKWNGYYVWMSTDGKLKYSTAVPTSDSPAGSVIIGP